MQKRSRLIKIVVSLVLFIVIIGILGIKLKPTYDNYRINKILEESLLDINNKLQNIEVIEGTDIDEWMVDDVKTQSYSLMADMENALHTKDKKVVTAEIYIKARDLDDTLYKYNHDNEGNTIDYCGMTGLWLEFFILKSELEKFVY